MIMIDTKRMAHIQRFCMIVLQSLCGMCGAEIVYSSCHMEGDRLFREFCTWLNQKPATRPRTRKTSWPSKISQNNKFFISLSLSLFTESKSVSFSSDRFQRPQPLASIFLPSSIHLAQELFVFLQLSRWLLTAANKCASGGSTGGCIHLSFIR